MHTADGPALARDLVGRPFAALIDGVPHPSTARGFFATGVKPVYRLRTAEGVSLRLTADHRVRRVTERTRWRTVSDWIAAGELREGDEVVLHDHGETESWDGPGTFEEGYLLGLLLGDGTLKADKAVLCAWPGRAVVNGGFERPGVPAVMAEAERAVRTLGHRSDFAGWMEVAERGERRMSTAAVKALALRFGMAPGAKAVTEAIERGSAACYRGFLRGLFDADGSVQGSQSKGVSVRL